MVTWINDGDDMYNRCAWTHVTDDGQAVDCGDERPTR